MLNQNIRPPQQASSIFLVWSIFFPDVSDSSPLLGRGHNQIFNIHSFFPLFIGKFAIVNIAFDVRAVAIEAGDIASEVGDIAGEARGDITVEVGGDFAVKAGDIAGEVGGTRRFILRIYDFFNSVVIKKEFLNC